MCRSSWRIPLADGGWPYGRPGYVNVLMAAHLLICC
jgi:hypothetical protein